MAITFDAPSTDWQTASLLSVEPRIILPIYQTSNAFIYERDYIVNPLYWAQTPIDTAMNSTTLTATLLSGETTEMECDDVGPETSGGFPAAGRVMIEDELISYTGINYSTNKLTGLTRGEAQGNVPTSDVEHASSSTVDFAAWLIEETSPVHQDGDLVRWTRRYATVPDSWNDFEMRPFQFPGYYNDTTDLNYRAPMKEVGLWKVIHYYEHAPGASVLADIEVPAQAFDVVDSLGVVLEYVDDSSTPTYTTYTGYVSAETRLVVSDSVMERYAGNIWVTKKFTMKAL